MPGLGQTGTLGRNTFVGPRYFNVDLALVKSIHVDCDADTILLKVEQAGAACPDGYRSCFYREVSTIGVQITAERLVDPKDVYRT